MMADVPYQTLQDTEDIGVNDDSISDSGSERSLEVTPYAPIAQIPETSRLIEQPTTSHSYPHDPPRQTHPHSFNMWPIRVGTLQLVNGILLILIGVAQVIVLPLITDSQATPLIQFSRNNCYGIAIWCGLLLVLGPFIACFQLGLSGCVALRSAIYASVSVVYVYMVGVLISVPVLSACVLLLVIAYSSSWTTPHAYNDGGVGFGLQVAVTVLVCAGFLLNLHAFTLYCETVLCGELQLCRKLVHCCCPCCCPRVVTHEELMDEEASSRPPTERPPSLPV